MHKRIDSLQIADNIVDFSKFVFSFYETIVTF